MFTRFTPLLQAMDVRLRSLLYRIMQPHSMQSSWFSHAVHSLRSRVIHASKAHCPPTQSLEAYDRFFALATDMLCVSELDGTFTAVSPACHLLLGYSAAEMVGHQCLDFVHPHDWDQTVNAIATMKAGQVVSGFENRYRCKDGHYRWLQWTGVVIPDQAVLYAIARDITAQKRSQAQLQERDSRLRSLFEQSTLGMAYSSVEGLCLEANQPFCNFFGYTLDEMRSLTFRDVSHPEDLKVSEEAIAQLRIGKTSSCVREKRYIRKDGTVVWGKMTLSAIRNGDGEIESVAVILEDITAQKEHEAAFVESQKRYESLVHSIDGIVWEFDLSTRLFSFVSQKAEEVLGYPVERWKTEPEFWENHIYHEDREWVVNFCWESTQDCKDHQFEYRMVAADGRLVWLEDVVSVVVKDGKPIKLQGILINIGDRKQIEAERQKTEERLAQQLQREQLLAEITQHMRQSLDLNTILETTVTEVRGTLGADRALIFHIGKDQVGQVIQESVADGYSSVLRRAWPNECFPKECYAFYLQGKPRIIPNVEIDEWGSCLIDYAHEMGVKSKIVAPILQSIDAERVKIWGLLVLHACGEHRNWTDADADLLQHIADQLAIAIQQSELYHQLQHANRNLEYLATHDKLTKLANRRSFEDACQREWSRLTREQVPLSLIMSDLDYFKQYNDTYGHPAGDECLSQVAKAIQSALKRPGDLAARYGGEEFVILLPNTDLAGAIAVVRSIQAKVRSLKIPHLHSAASPYITLSLGIATVIPSGAITMDHLIAAADFSLYQAKANGRNCFAVAPAVSADLLPLRQVQHTIEAGPSSLS